MKNHIFAALVNDLRDVPDVQCKREIISRILTQAGIKPDGNEITLPVLEQQDKKRDVTLRESISEIRKLTDESGGFNFEELREEQDNSDWIRCSERNPEPLDWVIAYDEVGMVKAYICPHTKEWVRDNGDELYRVSHWQPLPAPPNTQTNGDDCRESGMEQTNNGGAS